MQAVKHFCFLMYIMAYLQKQARLKKYSLCLEQTSESSESLLAMWEGFMG